MFHLPWLKKPITLAAGDSIRLSAPFSYQFRWATVTLTIRFPSNTDVYINGFGKGDIERLQQRVKEVESEKMQLEEILLNTYNQLKETLGERVL